MANKLRQIKVYSNVYQNYGQDLFLVWEDTDERLTEDEYKDVVESYNLLLTQQYAEETFGGVS
jgi:hypothetical protein